MNLKSTAKAGLYIGIPLAVTGLYGLGMNELLGSLQVSESERIEAVNACAKNLPESPEDSLTLPEDCNGRFPLTRTIEVDYVDGYRTEEEVSVMYHLPSSREYAVSEMARITPDEETEKNIRYQSILIGGIGGAIVAGASYSLWREDRRKNGTDPEEELQLAETEPK